jgi:large subunit ribosomal protein L30
MATKNATAKIRLQYFRSKICTPVKHKLVVKGLGFTVSTRSSSAETPPPSVAWSQKSPISSASSNNNRDRHHAPQGLNHMRVG